MIKQPQHYSNLDDILKNVLERLAWSQRYLAGELDERESTISRVLSRITKVKVEQRITKKLLERLTKYLLPEELEWLKQYERWCEDREDLVTSESWEAHWHNLQQEQASPDQKIENIVNKVREEYLAWIRNRYSRIKLSGLSGLLLDAPSDVLLTQVYIDLSLSKGVEPLIKFRAVEAEVETTHSEESASQLGDSTVRNQTLTKYTPIAREKGSDQTLTKLWNAVAQKRIVLVGKPGSGKTTSLSYIALALAGEAETRVDDLELQGKIPIVVSLSDLARRLQRESSLHLSTYLYSIWDHPDASTFLQQVLEAGECVLLLDELDVVSNLRLIVEKINNFAASTVWGKNYIVIASRQYAFQNAGLAATGFQAISLQPINDKDIEKLIERWYSIRSTNLIELMTDPDNTAKEKLKIELRKHPKLMELAQNPLMLMMMVLMYWRSTTLPDSIIEVYQTATDTLLKAWPESQERVGIKNLRLRSVKRILSSIAYEMLKTDNQVGEDELLRMLSDGISREPSILKRSLAYDTASRWIQLIVEQSGFLIYKGPDNQGIRVFRFFHDQLGEYLAACYLAERWEERDEDFIVKHIHDSKWIEVISLLVQQLGLNSEAAPTNFMRKLLSLNSPWEEVARRDLLLAGRCLSDDVRVASDVYERLIGRLLELLTGSQTTLRSHALAILERFKSTEYQGIIIQQLQKKLRFFGSFRGRPRNQ